MATIKQIKDSAGATHDIVDTKNTAGSTNSSSKLYLIGATEQAENPQTYSYHVAYVDTDGCLYSNNARTCTIHEWTCEFQQIYSVSQSLSDYSVDIISSKQDIPKVGDIIKISFKYNSNLNGIVDPTVVIALSQNFYVDYNNRSRGSLSIINYDDFYIYKILPSNAIMYLKAMVINNSIIYANIIYNNLIGSISDYATNATNATNAENVNISTISSSSSFPLVFTNGTMSGNKRLYNDSVNSLHYNPNSNTLTSPTVSATTVSATNLKTTSIGNTTSGNSITFNDNVVLKNYSYVKGIFNFKGSDHENAGVEITGGSTTTPPTVKIRAKDSSTTNGIVMTGRNGNTAANIVVYSGSGGTCTITGGSTSISSDERLKDFTNDIDIDFDKLKQIPKKYFTWKNDGEKVLNIGTSAQEVENVYPEIVDENFNEDDETFYKSVDYSKLSIIALAAIDKINDRIVELENKIKELEQA